MGYDTSHRRNRHWEIASLFIVLYERCLWCVKQSLFSLTSVTLSVFMYSNAPPLSWPFRFADSIRGMLKLILVLMLAGASLSSTWFTLTCLSRVTHLPSTAGGYTITVKVTPHTCYMILFTWPCKNQLTEVVGYTCSCKCVCGALQWSVGTQKLLKHFSQRL